MAHMGPTNLSLSLRLAASEVPPPAVGRRGPRLYLSWRLIHHACTKCLVAPTSPAFHVPYSSIVVEKGERGQLSSIVRNLQWTTWSRTTNPWLTSWGRESASPPSLAELDEIHYLRQEHRLMVAHVHATYACGCLTLKGQCKPYGLGIILRESCSKLLLHCTKWGF